MHWTPKKRYVVAFLALCLITLAVYVPINSFMILSHPHNDFKDHISFARSLEEGGKIPEHIRAHPIWQISVAFVGRVLDLSLVNSAIIIQVLFQLILAAVIFEYLYQRNPEMHPFILTLLSLALMLVSQIMLLAFWDDLFYLGYLGMNTYHNPTINMLKPFALVLFIYSAGLIQGLRFKWWHAVISAFLVVISTLIKPNLIICLLPAAGIFLLIRLIKHQPFDWGFAILGLALPSIGVLTWQFLATYGSDQGGILFAPLLVMKTFSNHLLIKFFLSIWFPLLVSVLYLREAKRDSSMLLAWTAFFFGALFTYLLAEEGERLLHANWGWSGEIMMFILFVVATGFFFRQQRQDFRPVRWWGVLVFGFMPHLISGVIYLIYVLVSRTFI